MRFEFSAGGVVFKKDGGLKVLLIQPEDNSRPAGWSLPKGHIEKGEKASDTAAREVLEETGVKAEIISKVDDIGYFFKSTWTDGAMVKKKVSYFLMTYLEGQPTVQAGETSAVDWHDVDQALKKMAYKTEKEVLEKAIKMIENAK